MVRALNDLFRAVQESEHPEQYTVGWETGLPLGSLRPI
jgi:hypothetical protein